MHQLKMKWHQPASLHVPGTASPDDMGELTQAGTLAELIKLALETLPEAESRHVRIECGDTFLGYEAIRYAYYSVHFPLPRAGDGESSSLDVISASRRDPS